MPYVTMHELNVLQERVDLILEELEKDENNVVKRHTLGIQDVIQYIKSGE